jgi:hypothetical protein
MTRMITRFYDDTNIADIPSSAQMIAVYADGPYAGTEPAARKRFPHALIVTITVRGEPNREICDCETGDLTPPEAAHWALAEHKAGRHPTIYCSASPWDEVKAAVRAVGLDPAKDVSWWIAHYDGDPTIPAGAVAKQYLGSPGNSPGHYDESSVADYWPGVDPAPKPPKPTKPPKPPKPPKPTHDGTPFAEDMAKAVALATHRFTLRAEHKSAMDTGADKATDALIAAATKARKIKP